VAQFSAYQAIAIMPVQWEMHIEVGFDGLVADIAPLRAALSEDLTVTRQLAGMVMFSRVSRAGKHLWERSPEQVVFPGAKLISGWQGVTDALFRLSIRGQDFVLLQDTMHNLKTRDDLELLKMNRTYCKDHHVEAVTFQALVSNVNYASLKANLALLSGFKASIRKVIDSELGFKLGDGVQLEVSGGHQSFLQLSSEDTVIVKVTISPPNVTTAATLQSSLQSQLTLLTEAMCVGVVNVPGIDAVSKFDVDVRAVGSPKVKALTLEDLGQPSSNYWNRPCRNCRGVLRLRFAAPERYSERCAQLESLSNEQLAQRAQLCGLDAAMILSQRKETTKLILKCEKIIR
jgi:hypothetical protein